MRLRSLPIFHLYPIPSMDRLWAPWRLSYVTAAPAPATECIFCDACAGRDVDLLLIRGRRCYVILNLYPYNNGHLDGGAQPAPLRARGADAEEQAEMMALARCRRWR